MDFDRRLLFLLVGMSLVLYVEKEGELTRLTQSRTELKSEADRVRKERDELQRLVAELEQRVKEFERFREIHSRCDVDLKTLDGKLDQQREELDRLRKLLGKCTDHVDRKDYESTRLALERALEAKIRLEQALAKTTTERDAARIELDVAKKRLLELEDQLSRVRQDDDEVARLQQALQRLGFEGEKQLAEIRRLRYELDLLRANEVGRYFVGLSKEDKKVLFVVDHSGSMAAPVLRSASSKGIQDRWQDVTMAIRAWLTKIPSIDSAALILFSSRVRAFPSDYSLVKMDRLDGSATERGAELTNELEKVEPVGGTNLVEAMELALSQYRDVDAIVLFTDGRPTGERESDNSSASALCRKILDNLERAQSTGAVPRIYVVALGDYFDDEFGKFLVTPTTRTGVVSGAGGGPVMRSDWGQLWSWSNVPPTHE
jgi:predicted  nucleic acid-binding Zn-ribbon protein